GLAERHFAWSDRKNLWLKGKADAVAAFAVHAPQGVGRTVAETPLVGREHELAQAAQALENVQAGTGSILFVSGEPGIGKSRFLAELRRLATDVLWLEGRCVSYGESMPAWPFRELLRGWLGPAAGDPGL